MLSFPVINKHRCLIVEKEKINNKKVRFNIEEKSSCKYKIKYPFVIYFI